MDDKYIIQTFYSHNGTGRLKRNWKDIILSNSNIQEYLDNRYIEYSMNKYTENFYLEIIIRIKNKIEEAPRCEYCGKLKPFRPEVKRFVSVCIDRKCVYKYTAKYLLETTGYANPFQRPEVVKTIKDKYFSKSDEEKQAIKDKRESTVQERFNCSNVFQNESVKTKMKNTWQDHFGEGIINPGQAKQVKEKIYNTWLKRYGGHPFQNKEFYQNYVDNLFKNFGVTNVYQLKYVVDKIFATKLKNGTIGKTISKEEQEIVNKLKEYFPDLVQQYKDKERYPWKCDMYIPSLDLFIEYHGSQFHGENPYNPDNDKDKERLAELLKRQQDKKSEHYARMIYDWTIRDPFKLEIARESKINMIVIYRNNREKWLNFIITKIYAGEVKLENKILI